MRYHGIDNFIFALIKEMPGATLEQMHQGESDCFLKFKPSLNCIKEGGSTTMPSTAKPVTVFNIKNNLQTSFQVLKRQLEF